MKNYVEIKFSARLCNVVFARAAAAAFLLEHNLRLNIVNEIKTIISEAVTNAIVHGYEGRAEEMVFMSLSIREDELEITVADSGIGIADIEKAREPLYSTRDFEERAGLGFTIMDIFSDRLEVISGPGKGTTVIAVKNIDNEII